MMMGAGGAAVMENLTLGGAIVARGAGLVAETAIQSAGQSLIFGDKLGTAFLENLIMNLGSMGVLKALGSKVEEAARLEKATQSFWQKGAAAGKVVIKQTAAITGHAIMGVAMGYVAHKIVTGKAQPAPATLEEWLMHWSFWIEAEIPGREKRRLLADGGVAVDANGVPRGGPSFTIDKRVKHDGSEHRIDIEGVPRLTDFVLAEVSNAYKDRFGHPPNELSGSLGDDNKAIFQRAYVAEINKGTDPKTAEKLAAAETPFVQARGRLEYKDVDVTVLETKTVLMGVSPQMHTVPVKIHVTVRKSK